VTGVDPVHCPPSRLLVISGSSRAGSLNTRLAHLVVRLRPADKVHVVSDLSGLPFYDADLEADGVPRPVAELRTAVQAVDLLVLVTPEYNGTVPGLLANAVDWLSRPQRGSVLHRKPVLVLSASPSPSGGARAAGQLRAVLTRIGADVLAAGLSVPAAHARLGPPDPDPQTVADLSRLLDDALDSLPSSPAAVRSQGAA